MATGKIETGIKYIDISDSTPVNVNTKSGYVVTRDNFISAVPFSTQVICLPYYNNNILYLALKDTALNTVSGDKDIRVYYK